MSSLTEENLVQLKNFIATCKANSDVLHLPQLHFFKDFIESLGGKIPPKLNKQSHTTESSAKPTESKTTEECSDSESEEEPDLAEAFKDEVVSDQPMGDPTKIVTEEESDESDEKRMKAVESFAEEKYNDAIAFYTEAILINPNSALLFAKRGQTFLKLERPNACIHDCNKALELNPDSAAAYKFRGRAHALLGKWATAASDLRLACKIDYDEQTDELLKEVTPKARKLEQHIIKVERKRLAKEARQQKERVQKAREAHAEASKKSAGEPEPESCSGMPDMFKNLFQDPEVLQALTDPEVKAAIDDIRANPKNIPKYQNNPKVMEVFTKICSMLQGGGAVPDMSNPFTWFNPSGGDDDDVGLD